MLWSGSQLRRRRYMAGVALDAVAWLLGMTFVELVSEVENEKAVSPQVADDYLAAVELLKPTSELTRRCYGGTEDPAEENVRLRGYDDARTERAGRN